MSEAARKGAIMCKRRFAVATGLLVFGLVTLVTLLGLTGPAHAAMPRETVAPVADSDLDLSFGNAGVVTMNVPGTFIRVVALFNGKVLALLSQPDDPDYEWSRSTGKLVRFNDDGSLDTSFGINGVVEPRSVDSTTCLQNNAGFTNFAVQSDGKILAWYECGIFTRLMPNGATDNSFGQQGMVKAVAYSQWLATAPDGKLYLGSRGGGYLSWAVTRYFGNGELDAGFGMTGTIQAESPFLVSTASYGASLQSVVPLQNGGVILGHSTFFASPGYSKSTCYIDVYPANGQNRNRLPTLDNLCFYGIRDGNERMLVAGPCSGCTTRLNADGAIDTSFGVSGSISSTIAFNMQPRQHDNKLLCLPTLNLAMPPSCSGNWPEGNDPDILLARLDDKGARDSSFANKGIARFVFTYTLPNTIPPTVISDSQAHDVALEFNGRIVIAGRYRANVLPCTMPPNCTYKLRYFPVLLRLNGARFPIEKRYLPVMNLN
jgi:uncharacterized delta-60 repeat protein